MKSKMLQIPVDEATYLWANKGQKEFKTKSIAEFLRMVFNYHMAITPAEFKAKAERARIDAMLKAIEAKAQEIAEQKEQLEKQKEKLSTANA